MTENSQLPKVSSPFTARAEPQKSQAAEPRSSLTEEQREQLERCSLYKYLGSGEESKGQSGGNDEDPMRRRENFAISLRKQRRDRIIGSKRKKTMELINQHQHGMTGVDSAQQSVVQCYEIPAHLRG